MLKGQILNYAINSYNFYQAVIFAGAEHEK